MSNLRYYHSAEYFHPLQIPIATFCAFVSPPTQKRTWVIRKNPNDPARFMGKAPVTQEGEKAQIHYYLDTEKIAQEEKYDGLYAVCTGFLDDDVAEICFLGVSLRNGFAIMVLLLQENRY